MTHAEAFATENPAFGDPAPGCRGELALVRRDYPARAGEAWGSLEQEVYRCRACRARIGFLDGRLCWVEREPEGQGGGPPGAPGRLAAGEPGMPPSVRAVLAAIGRLAGPDGRCRASNPEIERDSGFARRPVQYALRSLEATGRIRIEGHSQAKYGRQIVLVDGPAADASTPGAIESPAPEC